MKVEKIAHDGAAEGILDGAAVRVHAMLPGEEGIVDANKKHGILVGTLKELTKASPSRKTPEELHYLSCSPWQVMEYALQAELKATTTGSMPCSSDTVRRRRRTRRSHRHSV